VSGVSSNHESALENKVKEVLAQKLGRSADTIRLEDDLLADLGLDSLALAELSASVEEMAGISLPGDELIETVTVGDLVRLLERTLEETGS
jgi:acyl carrier protein